MYKVDIKAEPTYWVKIYMSGPIEVGKQIIREFCAEVGLCVTIEPTTYIYTGGEEAGYVVGLVQYPKFPVSPGLIESKARRLANLLLKGTFQRSALLMTPVQTLWYTIENGDRL